MNILSCSYPGVPFITLEKGTPVYLNCVAAIFPAIGILISLVLLVVVFRHKRFALLDIGLYVVTAFLFVLLLFVLNAMYPLIEVSILDPEIGRYAGFVSPRYIGVQVSLIMIMSLMTFFFQSILSEGLIPERVYILSFVQGYLFTFVGTFGIDIDVARHSEEAFLQHRNALKMILGGAGFEDGLFWGPIYMGFLSMLVFGVARKLQKRWRISQARLTQSLRSISTRDSISLL